MDVDGTLTVGGAVDFDDTFLVDGATTLDNTVEINGDVTLENDETISNDVNGVITATATTFNVTGNLETSGTLDVQGGAVTLESDDTIDNPSSGDITVAATTVTLDGEGVVTGGLDVQGGNVVLQNDETISNDANGIITATATTIVAAGELVTTGGLDVQGGDVTLQGDDTIENPSAGTVTIDATTVVADGNFQSTGSIDAQGGNVILQNDETISNDVDGVITATATTIVAAGNLEVTGTSDLQGAVSDSLGVLTLNDKVYITPSADADAANYDNLVHIDYLMTGTGTKDRNYGLLIEGTREAGQELIVGDHDEAGLKIRVDTEAITTTAGTALRGVDVEAKADNPDGTVASLYGGAFTAKSDTSAGDVGTMIALTANAQNNAAVDDALMSADFRIMRQSATEPTVEYVVRVRNSSTSGTGADAGIYITSDYSSTVATDDLDYGIDMNSADITTADIRGDNGETLSNVTDTAWIIGGFIAAEEGTVIDLANGGTITPTATYQPITNDSGGSITTDTTTAIADGPVAGAILILVNEDAQDIVIDDGANTLLSGNITLTGGAMDTLTLIWNGADWVGVAFVDN